MHKDYIAKGTRLEMTREEFYAWCDEHWNTIEAIYKNGDIPSVDRINSNGHYSADNIQVLSLRDNVFRGRRDHRSKLSAVIELRESGMKMREVAQQTGVSLPTIYRWFREQKLWGKALKKRLGE